MGDPEFITGAANTLWGMSALLALCVFTWVMATRETAGDVRRLMVGVMLACVGSALNRLWWAAYRVVRYREGDASFFYDYAPHVASASAGLVLVAYFLHLHPYLTQYRFGVALYWLGAALILAVYAALILAVYAALMR